MGNETVKITKMVTATTAFTEIHRVYSTRILIVTRIHIVNVTAGAIPVQLCAVPPGGTPSQANALLWDKSIPANDFIEFAKGDIIDKGVSIQALASAGSSLNVWLFGTEE